MSLAILPTPKHRNELMQAITLRGSTSRVRDGVPLARFHRILVRRASLSSLSATKIRHSPDDPLGETSGAIKARASKPRGPVLAHVELRQPEPEAARCARSR